MKSLNSKKNRDDDNGNPFDFSKAENSEWLRKLLVALYDFDGYECIGYDKDRKKFLKALQKLKEASENFVRSCSEIEKDAVATQQNAREFREYDREPDADKKMWRMYHDALRRGASFATPESGESFNDALRKSVDHPQAEKLQEIFRNELVGKTEQRRDLQAACKLRGVNSKKARVEYDDAEKYFTTPLLYKNDFADETLKEAFEHLLIEGKRKTLEEKRLERKRREVEMTARLSEQLGGPKMTDEDKEHLLEDKTES